MSAQSSLHPTIPERLRAFKRKARKTIAIEWRMKPSSGNKVKTWKVWQRWNAYHDLDSAMRALRQKATCPWFEYRLKPDTAQSVD